MEFLIPCPKECKYNCRDCANFSDEKERIYQQGFSNAIDIAKQFLYKNKHVGYTELISFLDDSEALKEQSNDKFNISIVDINDDEYVYDNVKYNHVPLADYLTISSDGDNSMTVWNWNTIKNVCVDKIVK